MSYVVTVAESAQNIIITHIFAVTINFRCTLYEPIVFVTQKIEYKKKIKTNIFPIENKEGTPDAIQVCPLHTHNPTNKLLHSFDELSFVMLYTNRV